MASLAVHQDLAALSVPPLDERHATLIVFKLGFLVVLRKNSSEVTNTHSNVVGQNNKLVGITSAAVLLLYVFYKKTLDLRKTSLRTNSAQQFAVQSLCVHLEVQNNN